MPGRSGSLLSMSIKGRLFPVAADADTGRKLGGFENEVQANGDGSGRTISTRVLWALSGIQVEIDEDRGDQEFLQDIADTHESVAIAATYASNRTYQGTGTLSGEIVFNNQSATATIDCTGTRGKLTLQ